MMTKADLCAQVMAVAAVSPSPAAVTETVNVALGDRSYPIYIGEGLLDNGELLRRHIPGKRVLVVTNETIAPLYLERWDPAPPPPAQIDR